MARYRRIQFVILFSTIATFFPLGCSQRTSPDNESSERSEHPIESTNQHESKPIDYDVVKKLDAQIESLHNEIALLSDSVRKENSITSNDTLDRAALRDKITEIKEKQRLAAQIYNRIEKQMIRNDGPVAPDLIDALANLPNDGELVIPMARHAIKNADAYSQRASKEKGRTAVGLTYESNPNRQCTTCGGSGLVSCNARNCSGGTIIDISSSDPPHPCKICGGTGKMTCRNCGSVSSVLNNSQGSGSDR